MKKILCLLLAILLIPTTLAFVGCKADCPFCNNDPSQPTIYESYIAERSTTATCLEGGKTTFQCTYCDRKAKKEVGALGHNFVITKDEATCQNDGNTYYECNRKGCDETKVEFEKASSSKHKWTLVKSYETFYYEYEDYKCPVCSQTKTDKEKISMGSKLKNTDEEFYYATGAAKKIVGYELKYPSSAKFIAESQMEVRYNSSKGYYYIEGAVSAPNAFGVYTDYYFIVKTKIKVSGSKFSWYDYDCLLEQ